MMGPRSLLSQIGVFSLLASAAVAHVLPRAEEECGCTVRYLVVEMPETVTEKPTPTSIISQSIPTATADTEGLAPGPNKTATLGPCAPPADLDLSSPERIKPSHKVTLFYGGETEFTEEAANGAPITNDKTKNGTLASAPFSNATTTTLPGSDIPASSINMTLTMNHYVVALEYIQSVTSVECGDDLMTVKFNDSAAFKTAAESWESLEEELVIVTNHLGNCDAEFERGFFKVEDVQANERDLSISCTATKQQLEVIAEDLEMTFSSLPAATLTKRLTLDPKVSLSFGKALAGPTTLLDLSPYLHITADEASFSSTVTFSGYLKYNFWKWKLENLYFDIDASFDANVALSAEIEAAYKKSFVYAPDNLAYYLVNVPGIIALGPGVAFSIGVDVNASAAVDVRTSLGVSLPHGNVHVDLLDGKKTGTSGWTPEYKADAKISQKAEVGADISASLTVELAIKVLGGLIDLSSGLTATPRLNNRFTLDGTQEFDAHTGVNLPPNGQACSQGVSVKSDFQFDLDGYITKYWKNRLYSVELPLVDKCYAFA